jgi:DNA-binding winged helix-turn-helix (wHTH) protein
METSPLIFRFGPFEAKTYAQELSKNGTPLRLRGQPFAILELLLSRAGKVVTREDIRQKLWPADTFVDFEHGLNTSIKKLRQALCDSATEPRYIETIPRLGYRFIAPVEATAEPRAKKPTAVVETVSGVVAAPDSAPTLAEKNPVVLAGAGRPRLHLFLAQAVLVLAAAALAFNVAGARTRLFALFRSTKNASVAVASAPKPLPSIAVLPPQNLSNNSAEDYFADGMTDELTTDLAQFGSLRVISRTSAMHYRYSHYLSAMGRFPEAMEEAKKAQQIDPLSLAINTTLMGRYRDLGQYSEAIDASRRTLEMDQNFVPAHISLGSVYEGQGMWPEAIREYQKAVELSHNSPPALASLGHAYGVSGNLNEARKVLASLQQVSKRHYVSAFDMAVVLAGIGDSENSFNGWRKRTLAGKVKWRF